jgi:hypothetical protein
MPEAEEREFRDEAALLFDSGPSSPKGAGYGPLRGEKEVDVGAG